MPPGAKKRKAAKKKKQKETKTNPQGNDKLKSHGDEKGRDGGEGSSPSYSDHDDDHQHPFTEGNGDVEENEAFPAQPSAADAKSVEESPSDVNIDEAVQGKQGGDGVVRDLKSEESSERENVSDAHLQSAKESDYSNGNTSIGLNDETVTENAKDGSNDLVKEAVTFDELVKSIDYSHTKMTSITENPPVVETGNSVLESHVDPVKAVASISEGKCSDTGSALPVKSVASQVGPIDLSMKKNGNEVHPSSDIVDRVNDYDTPECSEKQPLITSAPRAVRKTSWLNCCGLFDVLTGSDR
ncbi:hypothetical protein TanjilG_07034 [Lupinus angustifolius]|uniref:Uncharacterized protein n=1 Tax=Lupinus angustifolius TaxID=3871 RepID=A0A4P1QXR0_LUPAN|nr:PREDICTED: uncharacterized protein LOC109327331 [Lupinus angustifolius]OIV97282.1 hypothetical protein TanjilG_07034 [Lupinus angustifolius]